MSVRDGGEPRRLGKLEQPRGPREAHLEERAPPVGQEQPEGCRGGVTAVHPRASHDPRAKDALGLDADRPRHFLPRWLRLDAGARHGGRLPAPRPPPLGKRATNYAEPVPTLHREAGYVFRFRANDGEEPAHVHVRGNGGKAKIWLTPGIDLQGSRGYTPRQVGRILTIAEVHRREWLTAWRRFFGVR